MLLNALLIKWKIRLLVGTVSRWALFLMRRPHHPLFWTLIVPNPTLGPKCESVIDEARTGGFRRALVLPGTMLLVRVEVEVVFSRGSQVSRL